MAAVSSDGLVTAKKAGTALIRARSVRNPAKYKTIKVTVTKVPAPKKILISPATTQMEKGATLQLSAAVSPTTADSRIVWATNNASIARVSSAGLVTALKAGTVKIRAKSRTKASVYTIRTLKIVDTQTVASVAIDDDDSVLRVGGSMSLSAKVLPATAPQSVSWSSNNSTVASVSAAGNITGKSAGSATITVKAGAKTDSIRVVVLNASPGSPRSPRR